MFWIVATSVFAFYLGYECRAIVSAAVRARAAARAGSKSGGWYFGVVRQAKMIGGGCMVVFEDGKAVIVPGADTEFAPVGKVIKIYNGCIEDDILKGYIQN